MKSLFLAAAFHLFTAFGAEINADTSLPPPTFVHELGVSHRSFQRRRTTSGGVELTPLYPGYGTHFAFIYVGTPPQRQSVIIDTGSHYTAFPCTGCSQCGQHTDSYWDMKNSSTAIVPKCSNQNCPITQSYTEGSSWRAFKVQDKLWVGGLTPFVVPDGNSYAIDFIFGCQTSETGLFRTQLADGIMGMSMDEDTLPNQLKKAHVTTTSMFALCFRFGGGIMTIGGVDQRVHLRPGVEYAAMQKRSGWYGVEIVDVQFQDRFTGEKQSLEAAASEYSTGRGCIVDSGTTDTYLPSTVAPKFEALFEKISGVKYNSANIPLSAEQLAKMPNVIFQLKNTDGKPFEVEMPWTNYIVSVGGGKYAFRIYLTEPTGTVLGANFMNGYNVIFDAEGGRIGFAKSNCKYEDFVTPLSLPPTKAPTGSPGDKTSPNSGDGKCVPKLVPFDACSASCDRFDDRNGYVAVGNQSWGDRCGNESFPGTGSRLCHVPCVGESEVRGDVKCPETPWSDCPKACIQSRMVERSGRRRLLRWDQRPGEYQNKKKVAVLHSFNSSGRGLAGDKKCPYTQQTRVCYTGACPVDDGDYLVFVNLRLHNSPVSWSYVHTESFLQAFSELFNVRESSIELLSDDKMDYLFGIKLHFQMRLLQKDYKTVAALTDAAEEIPEIVYSVGFGDMLLEKLNDVSLRNDGIDYARFGWMLPLDVEVTNAFVLPIGDVRDPTSHDSQEGDDDVGASQPAPMKYQFDLFLAGVALAAVLMFLTVLCIHYRLRQEHYALEKDKISGGMLRRMWNRYVKMEKQKNLSSGRSDGISLTNILSGKAGSSKEGNRGLYEEIQMSELEAAIDSGMLDVAGDDDDELGDINDN